MSLANSPSAPMRFSPGVLIQDRPRCFSLDPEGLVGRFDARAVRLAELLDAAKDRVYHALCLLMALPFVTPVPLPGFSMLFGSTVIVLGARLATGQTPWQPFRVGEFQLHPHSLARLVAAASRVMRSRSGEVGGDLEDDPRRTRS